MARRVKRADVAGGPQGLDSYLTDASGSKDQLTAAWDEAVRRRRASQETDQYASPNPAQQGYFNTFNNMQEDAATGPAGYNRQWVPLLQSLKGKRVNMSGSGLPTDTYADPTQSGHLTLQSDADVAALRSRARPMPEGHEAFMQRLYGNNPPDQPSAPGAAPPALPGATPPALPPPAPPSTTTMLPQQPPLGAVAALARQLRMAP